jgi:outer membrane receptor protein involved in Fe transport
VTVTSQKAIVRQEADKMVVNVEKTLSNSGLTAVEVLRKSPGVSVDKDGKIQLKGKNGVQVMIDDKVMYMSEEQIAHLLKSISSDQIKEIEIITSPSAKYDAVGNAGIINIKLKKGAYEGLNGTLNGSLGQGYFHKSNVGTNISYKKEKINFNTGYQYNNSKGMANFYTDRLYGNPVNGIRQYNSQAYYEMPDETHNVSMNGTYNKDDYNIFSFDFNTLYGMYKWGGQNKSLLYKNMQEVNQRFLSDDNGQGNYLNLNTGLGYEHKFDTNGTSINSSISFNKSLGDEWKLLFIQHYDSLGNNDNNPYIFDYKESNQSDQLSVKSDFSKTIFSKIKLESGIKYNYTNNFKPVDLLITENFIPQNASNYFNYIENIYAAYAMANHSIGKWKLQLGLRLENTQITGTQTKVIDTSFTRNYTNLFPSGNISFSPSAKTSYTLLYSRRITRPSGWQLNPVQNFVDQYSSWGGNPYLLPEYIDNIEFAHSIFEGAIISTINYAYTKDPIAWTNLVNKNSLVTVSGPRNMTKSENYGLAVAINLPVTKWWTTSNYFNIFNNRFVGFSQFGEVDLSSTAWKATSTQSFKLPQQFSIELSGNYDSPFIYSYVKTLEKWQLNLAVQKKIWYEKITLKIAYNDMFYTLVDGGTSTLGDVNINTGYKWDNRVLMFSLTYKFGNRLELK